MRNIALTLMYDGTAYHGWQVQKRDVTVAETLGKGPRPGDGPFDQVHRRRAYGCRRPR